MQNRQEVAIAMKYKIARPGLRNMEVSLEAYSVGLQKSHASTEDASHPADLMCLGPSGCRLDFCARRQFASFDGSGIEFRAEVFVVMTKRLGNVRFVRVAVALLAVLLCTLTSAMLAQDTSTTPAVP